MNRYFTTTVAVALATAVGASAFAGYKGPKGNLSKEKNQALWEKYCVGTADSTDVPAVNYKNKKVKKVAKLLSDNVRRKSYYFYKPILKAYGLVENGNLVSAPSDAPKGTTPEAHALLLQTCGEFRDRAKMVEAKINWYGNTFKLPVAEQGPIDLTKNLWSQISAHSYRPYLVYSRMLWESRKETQMDQKTGEYKKAVLGKHQEDIPVEGQTVCETKYIFSEKIAKGEAFSDLKAHDEGYKEFKKSAGNCTKDDLASYYDFRGDSNLKHYSPESNGMIWYATSIAGQCKGTDKAKEGKDGKSALLKDADCRKYFREPFRNRWNAARAGLAAWLFHSKDLDETIAETYNMLMMVPHREPEERPFAFRLKDSAELLTSMMKEWSDISDAWERSDIGFNEVFNLGKENADIETAYERLRDAVNRHTDWYNSGWDDEMGMKRDQAYSPFVASSYEMSASNGFTQPGSTVGTEGDGYKHWMYVFRVKKGNWYNTATLAKGEEVDFDRMWFDETSLGTNGLADGERAWDRLGSPLEYELDSILYLHNITTGNQVQADTEDSVDPTGANQPE